MSIKPLHKMNKCATLNVLTHTNETQMENEKVTVTANFTEDEYEAIKKLAETEQRTPTDMVRVLYRNIASGKIQVPEPKKVNTQRRSMPVTVTKADTRLFEEYESTHDMSVHKATKMLINAVPENFTLQTLNNEASTDDITEHLIQQQIEAARKSVPVTQEEREAAMRALMGKHRHSNSPRPTGLGNKEVDVA